MAAEKRGIEIKIPLPGFWEETNRIKVVFSHYTGTLSFFFFFSLEGKLIQGVKKRLRKLAKMVHIMRLHQTRGTAERDSSSWSGAFDYQKLNGSKPHDVQKLEYLNKIIQEKKLTKQEVAVFGNGRNDQKWLEAIMRPKGLAIAVDVGEGCAIVAMTSATIFVSDINNGLDLLLDPKCSIATLRTLGEKPLEEVRRFCCTLLGDRRHSPQTTPSDRCTGAASGLKPDRSSNARWQSVRASP